jgi:hypothetical protein
MRQAERRINTVAVPRGEEPIDGLTTELDRLDAALATLDAAQEGKA